MYFDFLIFFPQIGHLVVQVYLARFFATNSQSQVTFSSNAEILDMELGIHRVQVTCSLKP